MATKKQSTPPTTVDPAAAVQAYTGGSSSGVVFDPLPVTVPDSNPPMKGNAIGVPPYATDPTTGNIATRNVPYIDPATGQTVVNPATGQLVMTNEPVPWTATVQHMVGGSGFSGMQTQSVMPRYYEGDVEQILNNMPPEQLATLQGEMIDARVYGSKNPNIVRGIADQETSTAFRQVLTAANSTGLDYETVIQNYQKIAKTAPPPPPTPHVNVVTDPTDLRAVFKTAARNAIGHELTDAEAQRYVDAFQQKENLYGDQKQAAMDAGGGTVTAAPDPSTFLDEQLKQDQSGAYGQNALLGQVNAMRSMLTGPTLRTPGTG